MDHLELLDPSPEGLAGYTVLKHLGSGATADVFQVTATDNKRAYVLKQMPLANMSDEEKLRAKQEILVMDGVDHPNVVKFHESFSSDSSVDIVMEFCEGGTLEQLIERQRYEGNPFPEEVLIEWMAELLCALAHIHSKRILHRDLKTSNIFVTAKNHLKLGDFGVCTILTNANAKAESMIGTPLYFAPEVCENEAYDERSDVWSLGIVFYEMCTLRRPFEADNLFSLISKILTQEVAPFNTGLDITFEEIVRKMLSKNPNDRPTAQELIGDHLNVPKSHPSHPSQKPSRSRLIQQYYGPELKYARPWPAPSTDLGASRKRGEAGASAPQRPAAPPAKAPQEAAHKCGHNDAEDYISGEQDREKYKQLLNQTLGASLAAAAGVAAVEAAVADKKKRASTAAGAPSATTKSKTSKSSSVTSMPASSAPASKTSKASSLAGAASSKPPVTPRVATAAADSLASTDMDELKLDLARRRTEMFGEHDVELNSVPVVIEIPEGSIDALEASVFGRNSGTPRGRSATVRASSTFLEDIAFVLEQHAARGKKIKLEELDDAVQLLGQYKLTNYGLF